MASHDDIIRPLRLVPHALELQDYLIDLTALMTGKKKMPAEYGGSLKRPSRTFVNADDLRGTVKKIEAIFNEKGFLPPKEIENELIRRAAPGIPDAAIEIADHYAASDVAPDHLSGYQQKMQVPLAMALAGLYTQTTGRKVTVVEIDYSNMRGTNEHFERMLRAVDVRRPPSLISQEAMSFTDQSALIVATAFRAGLSGLVPGGAGTVIPLRTGGDELRLILPDVDADQANAALESVHGDVEIVTARLGLHDHPHSKRPLDRWSDGFGACGTAFELQADGQFEEAVQKADRDIQLRKIEIGKNRLDNPAYATLKPAGSGQAALYTDPALADQHLFDVIETINDLRSEFGITHFDSTAIPTLEDFATSLHLNHLLTISDVQDNFRDRLKEELRSREIALTPAQSRLLQIKAQKCPALDYASGTLLARDMPAMAGAALRTVHDINHETGHNADPLVMGVSLHNVAGLNEHLGHENSNVVLQYVAHNVIEQSLDAVGIGAENIVLSHMGGGEFRVVVQPVIKNDDGSLQIVDQHTLDQASRDMEAHLRDMNAMNVGEFLHRSGLRAQADTLPAKFADIANPRQALRPWEDGIQATIVSGSYRADVERGSNPTRQGGAIVNYIGHELAQTVRARREDRQAWAVGTGGSAPVSDGRTPDFGL